MSAPLLILALGLALGVAVFIGRARASVASLVAGGGSALLGAVALGAVLGEPFEVLGLGVKLEAGWTVLGRSLVLEGGNRVAVGFVLLSGAVFLAGSGLSGAPRRTPAVGLFVLLALAAALMVRPFVFAPTFLAGAAIVGCFALVRPQGGAGRAPPRLLIAYTLGMMAILVAGWLIEVRGVTAAAEAPARTAALLLALGLAIVVMTPPFHTWLTAAAEESHPLSMVMLATLLQNSGLFFLLSALEAYAWMRADPLIFGFLRGAGLLMIVVGGAWSLGESRGPRLVAYALLIDFGVALLAIATASLEGAGIALGMAVARTTAAAVWAFGVSPWRTGPTGASGAVGPPAASGIARAATVLGALSLAGVPLTAGFAGRWWLLSAGRLAPFETLGILFGMAAAFGGALRWLRSSSLASSERDPGRRQAALWVAAAVLILMALAPDLLFAWVESALAGLSGLLPPA